MFVSNACQFIIFPDPLGASKADCQVLHPWLDHTATAPKHASHTCPDTSPREALAKMQKPNTAVFAYTKIAIIENPFQRMVRLYDRIALTDPLWRLRGRAGIANPSFASWLENTQASGAGAGGLFRPNWRRFGAWSADQWSGGIIDHFVRADNLTQDLQRVFQRMKVAPILTAKTQASEAKAYAAMLRYNSRTAALIRDRYSSDLRIFQDHRLHPVRAA